MMKWYKILSNSKNAIEEIFNGTGDEWDEAEATMACEKASQDKDAWQLRCTMASERFDKECFAQDSEW